MTTNICKSINCPYWNEKRYGCEKYNSSRHCHISINFPELNSNEYYLSTEKELNLAEIKQANIKFFTNNKYYLDVINHQQAHPDWYPKDSFKVGSLD